MSLSIYHLCQTYTSSSSAYKPYYAVVCQSNFHSAIDPELEKNNRLLESLQINTYIKEMRWPYFILKI